MLGFLAAPENIVFVSALLLTLLVGVVQIFGIGFHADLADVPDADIAGGDFDLLSWLGVGKLPLLVLLVAFLSIFGTLGLIAQQLSRDVGGMLVSPWILVPAVGAVSVPLTRLVAGGLARILPRDHTTAIDLDWLVGKQAMVVTGHAAPGSPARARVEDHHGQLHYVMVEPNDPAQHFEEGEAVLLVRREAEVFRAVTRGDFHLPRL
ncbi:MAG: YqiJ family protein [Sphingomonas sp.]|uniref:YqiJ family protein n=1 Tax=Sphingomonas sp. TaxID=28214 RepID=UPI001B048DE7|nr:YqiJ family protein [Sphingomonas sp.]MBO9623848.1 YqiJ family protein [Sphingomonas sp.]